jgi:PEP-CTERM motif
MRVKIAALTLAIALIPLLPSRTEADTFQYVYTSSTIEDEVQGITGTINVVFDITAPAPPASGDVTSFISTSDPFGTVQEAIWESSSSGALFQVLNSPPPPGFGLVSAGDEFPGNDFLSPGGYESSDGGTVIINDLSAVPEPSSLLLLCVGLFGLAPLRRRFTRA